jgi:hypothetical protein
VECTFNPGAVIRVEIANSSDNVVEIFPGNFYLAQGYFSIYKTSGWNASKIDDNLQEIIRSINAYQFLGEIWWKYAKERIQIVGYLFTRHFLQYSRGARLVSMNLPCGHHSDLI